MEKATLKERLARIRQGRKREYPSTVQNEENGNEEHPEMPSCLHRKMVQQYCIAVAFAVFTTAILLKFKTVQCSFGYLFAVYYSVLAYKIRADYYSGKIISKATVCCSVNPRPGRSTSKVVFREDFAEEESMPVYYEFYVPGNKATAYIYAGYVYLIYFRENDKNNLLACHQL